MVFTSVNGVGAVFDQLRALKLDGRALSGLKIAAIGPATAKALEARGMIADVCPNVYTTEGLVAGFQTGNVAGRRFLLPRTDIADAELANGLAGLGAVVREITVYRTLPDVAAIRKAKEMLLSNQLDVVTFTSSSTVTNLMTAFGDNGVPLRTVKIACIGPKTAQTALQAGLQPDIVATEHTVPGLVDAIDELFRKGA